VLNPPRPETAPTADTVPSSAPPLESPIAAPSIPPPSMRVILAEKEAAMRADMDAINRVRVLMGDEAALPLPAQPRPSIGVQALAKGKEVGGNTFKWIGVGISILVALSQVFPQWSVPIRGLISVLLGLAPP